MSKLILLIATLCWLILRQKTKEHPNKIKTIKLRRLVGYSLSITLIWIVMKGFGIPQNQVHVEATYTLNNGKVPVLFGYSENRFIPQLYVPRLYTYNFEQVYRVNKESRRNMQAKHPYIKDSAIWVNYVGELAIFLLLFSWCSRSRHIDRRWHEAMLEDKNSAYDDFEQWAKAKFIRKLHAYRLLQQSTKRKQRLEIINEQKLAIILKALSAKGCKPDLFLALQKVKAAGISTLHVCAEHRKLKSGDSVLLNHGALYPEQFDKEFLQRAERIKTHYTSGEIPSDNEDAKTWSQVADTAPENRYCYPFCATKIIATEIHSSIHSVVKQLLSEDYMSVVEANQIDNASAVLHIEYNCSLDTSDFQQLAVGSIPVGYKTSGDSKNNVTKKIGGKDVPRLPVTAIYFGIKADWRLIIKGETVAQGCLQSLPDKNIVEYAFPKYDRFEAESSQIAHEKYFTTIARSNIGALVLQLQGKTISETVNTVIDKANYRRYKEKANEFRELLNTLENSIREEIGSEVKKEAASMLTEKLYEMYKDDVDAIALSIINNDIDPEMTLLILTELGSLFPEFGSFIGDIVLEAVSD